MTQDDLDLIAAATVFEIVCEYPDRVQELVEFYGDRQYALARLEHAVQYNLVRSIRPIIF